jgi:hypothetical protein
MAVRPSANPQSNMAACLWGPCQHLCPHMPRPQVAMGQPLQVQQHKGPTSEGRAPPSNSADCTGRPTPGRQRARPHTARLTRVGSAVLPSWPGLACLTPKTWVPNRAPAVADAQTSTLNHPAHPMQLLMLPSCEVHAADLGAAHAQLHCIGATLEGGIHHA